MNEDNNYQLKMQPILVNEDFKEKDVTKIRPLTLQPHMPHSSKNRQLTTDDLWSMWNVATKAKASINQGQRLENLSWRLWYSAAKKEHSVMDPLLANTCASILQEIQAASSYSDQASRSSVSDENGGNAEEPASPPGSPSIPIVPPGSQMGGIKLGNNEYLSRKKKKNIERFMRKYQKRLDKIQEDAALNDSDIDSNRQNIANVEHCQSGTPSTSATNTTDIPDNQDVDFLFSRRSFDETKFRGNPNSPSLLSLILSKMDTRKDALFFQRREIPERPGAPAPTQCLLESHDGLTEGPIMSSSEEEFIDCFEINDA